MKWAILSTAPGSTLELATSLVDAGFEAWAPVETVTPVPRTVEPWEKPLRPRKLPASVTRPMLPSFVFANADRRNDLAALARSPALTYRVWDAEKRRMVTRGHPFFRLFHIGDHYPVLPDAALEVLRVRERCKGRKPRGKRSVTFNEGDAVKLIDGAGQGLRGIVRRMKGHLVVVSFPGSPFDWDIPAVALALDLDAPGSIHVGGTLSE